MYLCAVGSPRYPVGPCRICAESFLFLFSSFASRESYEAQEVLVSRRAKQHRNGTYRKIVFRNALEICSIVRQVATAIGLVKQVGLRTFIISFSHLTFCEGIALGPRPSDAINRSINMIPCIDLTESRFNIYQANSSQHSPPHFHYHNARLEIAVSCLRGYLLHSGHWRCSTQGERVYKRGLVLPSRPIL